MQVVKYSRYEASVLATLLLLVTGITIILSYASSDADNAVMLINYITIMLFISLYISNIWHPAFLYSLCLLPIANILTCNPMLDKYISDNSCWGIIQAIIATSVSLMLFNIITNKPYAMKQFLVLMIYGILFTRNYTSIYCIFLLLYLYSPLGFKIRRFMGKYLFWIRLFTLPFILVSLPLILYINPIASCPVIAILALTYTKTQIATREGV